MADLQNFVNAHKGKAVDVDGQFGAQCFDLSRKWAQVNGVRTPQVLFAKDIYAAASPIQFTKTRYTRGIVPKPGSIFVMNGRVGGGAGHTGIVINANAQNMTVLDQNGLDPNTVATVRTFGYENVTGFVTPKGSPFGAVLDIAKAPVAGIQGAAKAANSTVELANSVKDGVEWFKEPANQKRIAFGMIGVILIIIAVYQSLSARSGEIIASAIKTVTKVKLPKGSK